MNTAETLPAPKPAYTLDMLRSHQIYKLADGTVVPGVTTILGILDKPALLQWAHKLGREGKDMTRARDQAADIGTLAHAMCEAHLRGMTFVPPPDVGKALIDRAETSFLHFLHWWEREGWSVENTELQMVSSVYSYGGTADIVAIRNGTRAIIDLKTGKAVYREARLQQAAYARLFEEIYRVPIDELYVVRIPREDNDHVEAVKIHNRAACDAAFRSCLQLYRALKEI